MSSPPEGGEVRVQGCQLGSAEVTHLKQPVVQAEDAAPRLEVRRDRPFPLVGVPELGGKWVLGSTMSMLARSSSRSAKLTSGSITHRPSTMLPRHRSPWVRDGSGCSGSIAWIGPSQARSSRVLKRRRQARIGQMRADPVLHEEGGPVVGPRVRLDEATRPIVPMPAVPAVGVAMHAGDRCSQHRPVRWTLDELQHQRSARDAKHIGDRDPCSREGREPVDLHLGRVGTLLHDDLAAVGEGRVPRPADPPAGEPDGSRHGRQPARPFGEIEARAPVSGHGRTVPRTPDSGQARVTAEVRRPCPRRRPHRGQRICSPGLPRRGGGQHPLHRRCAATPRGPVGARTSHPTAVL